MASPGCSQTPPLQQAKLTDMVGFSRPSGSSQSQPDVGEERSSASPASTQSAHTDETVSVVPESPPLSPALSLSASQQSTSLPWGGCPLNELSFGPSAYPVLPSLRSSPIHCVLFNTRLRPGKPPDPFPAVFKDVWDGNHVRMPCSAQSLYPLEEAGSNPTLVSKWELIQKAFQRPIANSFELEKAILSYNTRFAGKWRFARKWHFEALHKYFKEHSDTVMTEYFFGQVLPKIINLALSLPKTVTHALPLLKKQQEYSVTLSQHQVACLLANAFLCTYPRRNSDNPQSEYSCFPSINFSKFFSDGPGSSAKMSKLKCLLHYFQRVTEEPPTGVVTFTRQVCNSPPMWDQCHTPFTKLHVTSQGTIEDNGHGMLQVDFANKYVGGGVLGQGCVQEEIRFVICPELIVSRLFTEKLDDNEALVVTGVERYSWYKGYGASFKWTGDYVDHTLSDDWRRKMTQIVAIDALSYCSLEEQFEPAFLQRELNKAYTGFKSTDRSPSGQNMAVATGNWGCGAFEGDPRLKALLQWMAASAAGRDLVYFTFRKPALQKDLARLNQWVATEQATVSKLWDLLMQYTKVVQENAGTTLYNFIIDRKSK